MILELAGFGIFTGFVSGFFGVGGGMILVPMLLIVGYVMKEAVAISIMQMVFSSIYGSFLNLRYATHVIKDGLVIGIGGLAGGLQSGYIVTNVSNEFLQYLFLTILIFAIVRIFYSPAEQLDDERKNKNKFLLFIIGFFIGIVAMSIGVGGSILLTPILVGFLRYDLKAATALGLFFVIFSSIGGFTSISLHGQMLFFEGTIVGLASLIGVYFGIKVKHLVHATSYKKYILIFYVLILIAMLYKTI
uniref:sulfite exporter TauE/SafE family protein n=1 Tax=Aliarcobacter sp. TaxID=2321116 RepID=UPI0040477389